MKKKYRRRKPKGEERGNKWKVKGESLIF